MEHNSGFYKLNLAPAADQFAGLSRSALLEPVAKGRQGNHLVRLTGGAVPLVRTTTRYQIPPQEFTDLHLQLVEQIGMAARDQAGINLPREAFNNALIEIYERVYAKMKFHSDQALDLAAGSYIALFSCYERPEALAPKDIRKLVVQNKTTGEEFEFSLDNNSVMLFSLETNRCFQHKIVLDPNQRQHDPENRWLGITFRQSGTWVQFQEGRPVFPDGKPLTLADEGQQKEFFRLRGEENRSLDFAYPELRYTLSEGDLLPPISGHSLLS